MTLAYEVLDLTLPHGPTRGYGASSFQNSKRVFTKSRNVSKDEGESLTRF